MSQLHVHLDREVYSHEVVIRTAHRYSDRYLVEIDATEHGWILRLSPSDDAVVPRDLDTRLRRDALDELLRESVRRQTGGLQCALIQAALTGARLSSIET